MPYIKLTTTPEPGNQQYEFERTMQKLGYRISIMAISLDGAQYVNIDINRHWLRFQRNSLKGY